MARARRPDEQLTRSFHLAEFDCRDGTPVPITAIPGLLRLCVVLLQPARDRFGACYVTSGYRPPWYNRRIGGAPNSHHQYDQHPTSPAADVRFTKGTPLDWYRFMDARCTGGVGRYASFVHVDLRAGRARW